jgi:hypothetical protein
MEHRFLISVSDRQVWEKPGAVLEPIQPQTRLIFNSLFEKPCHHGRSAQKSRTFI